LSVTHSAGKRSRVSTVRHDDTLVDSIPVAVSARRPAPAHECAVCERLQRNETDGKPDEQARSSEQTVYSWSWATGTASYLWNHVAVSLLEQRGDDRHDLKRNDKKDEDNHSDGSSTLLRNARVLAALDIAVADATIGCWDAKYT